MSTGYPSSRAAERASSAVMTVWPFGRLMPERSSSSSKRSRSSAMSMVSAEEPKIGTLFWAKVLVSLMAVWPPKATTTPMGFSMWMMSITSSGDRGSKYSRSAVSKSVETVSGLLLMMTTS